MHMYKYDVFDHTLVDERVAQFRGQVARRLSGQLNEEEFRPLRLRNGLYLQLHSYMLRVAIPYGLLSSVQMRTLARIARVYDRGYGHFTTRQNIQFHWVKLDSTPDILAELAQVEMHAIQTSGNAIRNVTTDAYAGVAADEIEDPRPYAEAIRQWSTLHPEFSFLPRKFKIALSGAPADRAATAVHDVGLSIVRNGAGETGFRVSVGGGLGRTPMIGQVIREFLPKRHLLSYLEAILRVYNLEGRRDNLNKARIKILVAALGVEEFARRVESEWEGIRDSALKLEDADIAHWRAFFAPPAIPGFDPAPAAISTFARAEPEFDRWLAVNLVAHKDPGHAIVNVSLKAAGNVPGDATARQMNGLADLADDFSQGMIRVTHQQNLVLADVRRVDLHALWRGLRALGLGRANIGRASDVISCPGLDFCGLANARSIPIAQQIAARLDALDAAADLGELRVNISGCINACGHHHVGHIGLLGVDKQGEEHYQITLGGSSATGAALGKLLGPAVPAEGIAAAIETIARTYLDARRPGETFLATLTRVGLEPFRERVYGPD